MKPVMLCVTFICRDVMVLTEAIGIKDKEAEAYISEIEVRVYAYILFMSGVFLP